MSTELTQRMQCASSEATEQLGEQLGRKLKGGEVVELISDLGGGKTTLVRGIVRGMGSADRVASPTFTISKVYMAGDLELHHFDFYRLGEAGLIGHELADVLGDPSVVIVIEWGAVVAGVLPEERLKITITKTSDEAREVSLQIPEAISYLAPDRA